MPKKPLGPHWNPELENPQDYSDRIVFGDLTDVPEAPGGSITVLPEMSDQEFAAYLARRYPKA